MAAHRSWTPCFRFKFRVRPAVDVNHSAEAEPAMLATRFTELVGCSVPIQQAGMGAVAPPELAAAVSEAGGPTDRAHVAALWCQLHRLPVGSDGARGRLLRASGGGRGISEQKLALRSADEGCHLRSGIH